MEAKNNFINYEHLQTLLLEELNSGMPTLLTQQD